MTIKFKALKYPVCKVPKHQVCLQTNLLKGLPNKQVNNILKKCSLVSPVAVFKDSKQQQYCHVSFKDKTSCALFYYLYYNKKRIVCKKLKKMCIMHSRDNGESVKYTKSETQDFPLKEGCECRKRSHHRWNSYRPYVPVVGPMPSTANNSSDCPTDPTLLREEIKRDELLLKRKKRRLEALESVGTPKLLLN